MHLVDTDAETRSERIFRPAWDLIFFSSLCCLFQRWRAEKKRRKEKIKGEMKLLVVLAEAGGKLFHAAFVRKSFWGIKKFVVCRRSLAVDESCWRKKKSGKSCKKVWHRRKVTLIHFLIQKMNVLIKITSVIWLFLVSNMRFQSLLMEDLCLHKRLGTQHDHEVVIQIFLSDLVA